MTDWAEQQAERERLESAAWHTAHEPVIATANGNGTHAGPDTDAVDHLRSKLLRGAEITKLPKPVPLIAGFLDLDSLALLYGPSGSGKSFIALDWAMSVATGSWWLGHAIHPGPVLYVIAEGATGFGDRVEAWQQHQTLYNDPENAIWLPVAVDIHSPTWAQALATLAAELGVVLVVVDTLARSMVGADENSGRDMGIVIHGADLIRRATQACVLLVHHTGKNIEAGARGHSALLAAVDSSLACKSADDIITLETEKQKNHAGDITMRLKLTPTGDSCAVDRYRGGPITEGDQLPRAALELLATLSEIDTGTGVSSTTWRDSSGVAVRTFYRWQKGLLALGFTANIGSDKRPLYTLTDQGIRETDRFTATLLPTTATDQTGSTATLPPPLRGGSSGSDSDDETEII